MERYERFSSYIHSSYLHCQWHLPAPLGPLGSKKAKLSLRCGECRQLFHYLLLLRNERKYLGEIWVEETLFLNVYYTHSPRTIRGLLTVNNLLIYSSLKVLLELACNIIFFPSHSWTLRRSNSLGKFSRTHFLRQWKYFTPTWTEIPGFWPVASPLDCTSWSKSFVIDTLIELSTWLLILGLFMDVVSWNFFISILYKLEDWLLYILCSVQASGILVFWAPTCLKEFWQDSDKCSVLPSHYNKNCLAKWFQWKLQWEYCLSIIIWIILAQSFILDKREVRTYVSKLELSMGKLWGRPLELLTKVE